MPQGLQPPNSDSIPIQVKWNGKLYNGISWNSKESVLCLRQQIAQVTGLPPERQKIIVRGLILKDETDLSSLAPMTPGQTIFLMGTPANAFQPVSQIPCLESESKNSSVNKETVARLPRLPRGLVNVGNSCYFNAVSQAIFHLTPDEIALQEIIQSCTQQAFGEAFQTTYQEMKKTSHAEAEEEEENSTSYNPLSAFIQLLFLNPTFRGQGLIPQDRISFATTIPPPQQDAEECFSFLLSLFPRLAERFHLELQETCRNLSNPGEEAQISSLNASKVQCQISQSTKSLEDGIKEFLHSSRSKTNSTTGQEEQFEVECQISKSPAYLLVQMSRFSFKQQQNVTTKILKKVPFPLEMTLQPPITTESNGQRNFKLRSIITHKGRSLDSGHYICWSRIGDNSSNNWVKFDDFKVDSVSEDEVRGLSGGGDWHMSYLLIYERVDDLSE